jgi:hypothetical protein
LDHFPAQLWRTRRDIDVGLFLEPGSSATLPGMLIWHCGNDRTANADLALDQGALLNMPKIRVSMASKAQRNYNVSEIGSYSVWILKVVDDVHETQASVHTWCWFL